MRDTGILMYSITMGWRRRLQKLFGRIEAYEQKSGLTKSILPISSPAASLALIDQRRRLIKSAPFSITILTAIPQLSARTSASDFRQIFYDKANHAVADRCVQFNPDVRLLAKVSVPPSGLRHLLRDLVRRIITIFQHGKRSPTFGTISRGAPDPFSPVKPKPVAVRRRGSTVVHTVLRHRRSGKYHLPCTSHPQSRLVRFRRKEGHNQLVPIVNRLQERFPFKLHREFALAPNWIIHSVDFDCVWTFQIITVGNPD